MVFTNYYQPSYWACSTLISNEELCTVGCDHAVITWVTPQQSADTTIYFGEQPAHLTKHTINYNTEFHWMEIDNLKPATRYWYQVASNRSKGALNSFMTLPRPAGKYLFSFAILSDIHIAGENPARDINEIYLGKLVEYSNALLVQCILDCKRRNTDLVVITGDLTDNATRQQYLMLRNLLLPYFGDTPYLLCIGNHDKYTKNSGLGEKGFLDFVANRDRTITSIMFRDYQFLLIDSCKENNNWGYIDPEQLRWIKSILKNNKKPAYLFLHHPCNGPDTWFGVKNYMEFQKTIRPFSNVQGVFSGHIHRNKVTTNHFMTGSLPYVEVPATVQFPCAYAIVQVYENGFTYNTYKVSRLDLSEVSRDRFILKGRGNALFTRYSFGGIGDRSFSFINGQLFCPRQYELTVTLDQQKAITLYKHTQSVDGASLTTVDNMNKFNVVLGRYDSLQLAIQSHRNKFLIYRMNASISKEGSGGVPQDIKLLIEEMRNKREN
ncbi:MAG: metallophosphoesterase family protein [Desulfotomaculaceae bacterium]|nr:metallophosphoesterase family protein [Desulfotomaculaceae bacterium]